MMKRTVLLLLAAAAIPTLAFGQQTQFATAQAARLVIGQIPFTAQDPGASDTRLGSLNGVAYGANTLVVADSNRLGGTPDNNRVLIFNNVDQQLIGLRDTFPQGQRCPACVGQASVVLGQPDFSTAELNATAQNTLRRPLAVAYNGRYLAVADTDNNRVLIWNGLPASNQAPATYVVGQPDFTSYSTNRTPSKTNLRAPQGVWLDAKDGLWVADTGANRVLYYGPITKNGQEAILVLGQPDFTTNDQTDLALVPKVAANTMRAPLSVMTDGQRLVVADAGLNRVLVWNSVPTTNRQSADVVVGQAGMDGDNYMPNDSSVLCASNGTDSDGNPTYPALCAATLSIPRYALLAGDRLIIADGGNDRVLIYSQVPTANAASADIILGQQTDYLNQTSDSGNPERVASTDSFKTPGSLAWDGTNLYVADIFNRRILVFSPADFALHVSAVRNAASPFIYARGSITFGGTITEGDVVKITIGKKDPNGGSTNVETIEYSVTTTADDSPETLITKFADLINAGDGDPKVIAVPNLKISALVFQARAEGVDGNDVTLETSLDPTYSTEALTTSGTTLSGGQDAARIAPYTLVSIVGDDLVDNTSAVQDLTKSLPGELANTRVYFDGIQAPLVYVSPTSIVAQMPVAVNDSTSASAIIRTVRNDGRVTVSTPAAVRVIAENPGVFSDPTRVPSPGLAYHYSSAATGTVSVDGTATPGDQATVVIRDRPYTYTVVDGDTLISIRDALIALVNAGDPEVIAYRSGFYSRVRLMARVPGPEGDKIPFSAYAKDASGGSGASVIMTATNSTLCCANRAGALITNENPAVPGETIVVYATGLGLVGPDAARDGMIDGQPYDGPAFNDVNESVSSLAGGKTANVLFSGVKKGWVGIYEVHLELNSDIPTDPITQVTIAQSYQVSNIFLIPVFNPNPSSQ
jgi:uncharacterized protein (TIGR03437 family)